MTQPSNSSQQIGGDDQDIRQWFATLSPWNPVEPSPQFPQKVMAHIPAQQVHRRWWEGLRLAEWRLVTPALAVCLLVMSNVWFLIRQEQHSVALAQRLRAQEQHSVALAQQLAEAQGRRSTRGPLQAERTLYTLTQKGLQYEQEGNTAQAIAAYQEALNQLAIPLNQLAWLLQKQGEATKGLPLARLAVQLRPEDADVLDTFAVILCRVGDQAEAVRVMETAATLHPRKFEEKLAQLKRGVCP